MFDISSLDRNRIDTDNEFVGDRTADPVIEGVRKENVALSFSTPVDHN